MLLFEDIHWADPSLLDLISFLASRVRDVPLLLVSTARADFMSTRESWGGGLPAYSAMPLEPLGRPESVELAGRLLEQRGLAELADRASALASTGEGNPLFLEELTATIAERPVDRADQLPTSIRGIVGARLDALPAPEREVLMYASVVGKVFWRGAIAGLGPERSDLSVLLGSLEQRDLIRREAVSGILGEQQFIFKHGLIRDVAYLTLPRAERRQRHAAVARFLEGATPDPTARAAALAYHWREAGDRERALRYLLSAAEQAGRGWAKERALRLYQEALELVPEDDAERRREIFRKQAVMAAAAFHVPDAERLAGRQGDPPQAG
jgi:predicted ATPase